MWVYIYIFLTPFNFTPVSSSDIMNEDAIGIVMMHCVDTVGKWETHMNQVVAKTQLNVPTAGVNMQPRPEHVLFGNERNERKKLLQSSVKKVSRFLRQEKS